MTIYSINPVTDARWRDFVEWHPCASVFHTPEWLEALARTYAYEPLAYTTSATGKEIKGGQVFCGIDSWVTGKRLVSVPFSDHCALLWEGRNEFQEMANLIQEKVDRRQYNYVEIRPVMMTPPGAGRFAASKSFYWHRVSLGGDLDAIFKRLHPSCAQRKIRRAERERLDYVEGRSELLIQQFYRLLTYSRRRYGLPPQPISWFRNLVATMGRKLKFRLAISDGNPIAGIMTLAHKRTMVYKYGCSDPHEHKRGGMAMLFWKTIQDAKNLGFDELDMGRSDCTDLGLVAFKEHWGADRQLLTYSRYPATATEKAGLSWKLKIARRLFGVVPAPTLATAGKFLYKHVG